MDDKVRLILDSHAVLGEGAIWDEKKRRLYWVDIDLGLVHVYDPVTGRDRSINVGQPVGTVVPRASGGLILAVRDGFMSLDERTGRTTLLAAPEGHNAENRFNDGKCDPAGRFWAGTMEAPAGKGVLFRLDKDLSVHRMLDGIRCSNGIVWSQDKNTMYYIDTPTMKIDAFDYNLKTGAISNRRAVVSVAEEHGHPDGMTIDAEGKLWVAHWDGWCICRWDPSTGNLIQKVTLPVAQPTSCAFGDQNLDRLYVTSASCELDADALAKQPTAGGLFQFKPGVRGVSAFSFAG
ncbi:MAG: SMP-30/gluconolactonase/LRE family protein [Candidatus Bathyarchaeia archaeon]